MASIVDPRAEALPRGPSTRPSPGPQLIILAWGNESRGDDGAGPELARRLRGLGRDELVVIEDMQLQIEHVADIVAGVPVLFVDASVAIDEGFAVERIAPRQDPTITTHAVSPQALLQLYELSENTQAPPAWQLHIAGRDFGLGAGAGAVSRAGTEAAWECLQTLLEQPPSLWPAALNGLSAAPAIVPE